MGSDQSEEARFMISIPRPGRKALAWGSATLSTLLALSAGFVLGPKAKGSGGAVPVGPPVTSAPTPSTTASPPVGLLAVSKGAAPDIKIGSPAQGEKVP